MAFVFRHNKTFARTLLCRPKSFSTLKLQQKLFADPRRISLLKHIALSGSISQGAKDAGISYKSAWDAINEMNQLSEHILVERATGGKGGGGAVLTRYGRSLPFSSMTYWRKSSKKPLMC